MRRDGACIECPILAQPGDLISLVIAMPFLTFLYLVAVLAATGAAVFRAALPNTAAFSMDKDHLERVAWGYVAGALVLLGALHGGGG